MNDMEYNICINGTENKGYTLNDYIVCGDQL